MTVSTGGDRRGVQQSHRCPSNGCYSMARCRMHQILDRVQNIDQKCLRLRLFWVEPITILSTDDPPLRRRAREGVTFVRSRSRSGRGGILLHPRPERDRSKTQARHDRSRQMTHHSDAHDLPVRPADVEWNGMITASRGSGAFPSAEVRRHGRDRGEGRMRDQPSGLLTGRIRTEFPRTIK